MRGFLTAATGFEAIQTVLLQQIVSPIIWFLLIVAVIYFLWGIAMYIWKGASPQARIDGQKHMLWGILGIGIMISVFGILSFVFNTVTNNGQAQGINNQKVNPPSILDPNQQKLLGH